MNPEDVSLDNIGRYAEYLIIEFYKNNLNPFFDALDENVIWCGALYKQYMHGKKEILEAFAKNPQDISYSLGPIYTEVIPHGKKQCDTMSFFERYAYYEDGSEILWHLCFHLSWVKNDVWQMSVIGLCPKAERDDRDSIYQSHPLGGLPVNVIVTDRFERIIFKEKKTGNSLYLSPLSIEWIEGAGHYSIVHFGDIAIKVTESLAKIREKTEGILLQCHSGYIVNPYYVMETGRFFFRLSCGKVVPVPERKYTAIKEKLNSMLLKKE